MNKSIFIILLLCFSKMYSQKTNFGDVINGNVKKYKEVWYNAKKDKSGYTKMDKLHYDTYVKNENNEFIKERIFPLEKHEIPQNSYNNSRKKSRLLTLIKMEKYEIEKIISTKTVSL